MVAWLLPRPRNDKDYEGDVGKADGASAICGSARTSYCEFDVSFALLFGGANLRPNMCLVVIGHIVLAGWHDAANFVEDAVQFRHYAHVKARMGSGS